MGEQFAGPASSLFSPKVGTLAVAAQPTAGQGLALDGVGRIPVGVAAQGVPVLTADPASPVVGQVWYRSDTSQLCVRHDSSTTKRVSLA